MPTLPLTTSSAMFLQQVICLSQEQPIRAVGRDRVTTYSKQRYVRPRTEVEKDMAIHNGWPLPDERHNSPQSAIDPLSEEQSTQYLRQRLCRIGLLKEEVDTLMSSFPREMIEVQLEWLPYRHAKNPARYLLAAIQGDYDEPFSLRVQTQQKRVQDEIH